MSLSVLIVDDDLDICQLYQEEFKKNKILSHFSTNVEQATKLLSENKYEIVLIDIFLNGDNSLKVLRDLIKLSPTTRFFPFTSHESIPLAVKAMEIGASGFLIKSDGCVNLIEYVLSQMKQKKSSQGQDHFTLDSFNLVSHSQKMQNIFRQIQMFSKVDSTILITGESGTGKEVVSNALHQLSDRKNQQFVAINCGAIPEALLESELFGHKKGSFTDAKVDKKGLFEVCTNGTLMLDEIGDMPLPLQVKLLRVLQEKEVRPLGSATSIKVNPRIIACTHQNLENLVEKGLFRQDLLFRLSVLKISLPPLRERIEDLPLLINVFLEKFNSHFGKSVLPPAPEILRRLEDYSWPGNIRELQNSIERAIVLSNGRQMALKDLLPGIIESENKKSSSNFELELPLVHELAKEKFEKSYIVRLLKKAGGNISEAARLSGKHRIEIYRMMDKYKLKREDFFKEAN
ncbi:MAG: sigma-54-dependent Fis family transcriptional regulator [Bdellovibrionales bacterium]|nr:sigma-54-dependent Fis family transcriptional regulator [Bdellovibrionales bacterium]